MKALLFFALLSLFGTSVFGAVRLPAILSDGMVVQKTKEARIWGWADPGEKVEIELAEVRGKATTGADGQWQVLLNVASLGAGPFELRIRGTNEILVKDVLLGEVWLASGQSNMDWPLKDTLGAQEEISASENPMLRYYRVKTVAEAEPKEEVPGEWLKVSPETAGRISGIGYHFGKILQKELGVPIAVILAPWGGTPIEAWMSPRAVASDPALQAGRAQVEAKLAEHLSQKAAFVPSYQAWLSASGRQDRRMADPSGPLKQEPSGWTAVTLPGHPEAFSKPGAVWFRRTVTLTAEEAGKTISLYMGPGDGFMEIYWNGEPFGSTTVETHPGRAPLSVYSVKNPKQIRAGENDLAIRVFSPAAAPGVQATAANDLRMGAHLLKGEWRAWREFELPPLTPEDLAKVPQPPVPAPASASSIACRLYNGMIHALSPFTIAGVIWYQGENNIGRAAQYRTSFPLLIHDWRCAWSREDLPFYWCQLANLHNRKTTPPADSQWAELRDAQSAALGLPHTGQAVTIDVGESNNIHPYEKEIPARRLAALALAKSYGRQIPCSGPVLKSSQIQGDKIVITFAETSGGLVAAPVPESEVLSNLPPAKSGPIQRLMPDSPLEGFAICNEDGTWSWARAEISGETVIVSSPQAPKPVAVRYAWADNPLANLYNGAGFPASPFRTDSLPLSTKDTLYPN
jgi:sialate O-acetylesterase